MYLMEKIITKEQKNEIAVKYGLEYATVCAVMDVESSGSGFDKTSGFIKIQFEPHIFDRYKVGHIENGIGLQHEEWVAFDAAYKLNQSDAMLSTSWGLGQIMGFNHTAAGYDKVEDMVTKFKESEYYQLDGMMKFICSCTAMKDALIKHNWDTFASYYNGKGYLKFNYAVRLATAYAKYHSN